jgi:hypothetical protein
MPCVWSQVSKKMSMKIQCNFQVRTAGSCATVRTGLWRSLDSPQCLKASALKTSGHQTNTVWMLGQASPILHGVGFQQSTLFGKFLQDVWTTSNIPEYFEFPLWAQKGDTAKTVRMLGQDIWTWTCYGKNCAILERRLQSTVRTLGQAVLTPSSILIITFYSNIGLGWNWCHWKDNKKWDNLIIWTAKINFRKHTQSPNLCWCRTPYLSWNRICKAYIKRALGMHYVKNSVLNSLSFERGFRKNWRSSISQAVTSVCSTVRVKSILGVGPKVNESIKNPFRWKIWLESVRVGLHVRVRGMTTA